ncbi:GNAT family N-acetyltransferase [Aerococcaceae bacterium zg-ZJ1578]|uniref:GNAT family N-acetyltransferase n=1 Tax=Aerococcaceae TaxID=186827 RepID=UPI0013B83B94|nr:MULTISPECIES: GNAT family N-acetyltransferase [unclassified Facklamia]MBK0347587.1 GNAT family N-acetyltransferase [Aerococcaceae bacterium zg-1578]MBR7927971.1 GNAT family N-acetyltransferase [Aerococcaceae bacterium zg-ZUI334]MBS4461167.1 GNAT family N-acetyltransferase [Aerococcaceae bacterium zg-B36]QQD64801.1 GNAT family N-acetyltransferase [Aerococcaceae bacterium zg-252]NEW64338.1 GNAT family N-acetyltransferase [Facklamia sp. 252]
MLIRSKHKNEKIVWGLMSYTFDESISSNDQRQLLNTFREEEAFEIFLFRKEEQDNFIGAMVIEEQPAISEEVGDIIVIHRLAVLPSYRNEGIGYQMYLELRALYPTASFQGSIMMSEIVKNWSIKYHESLEETN